MYLYWRNGQWKLSGTQSSTYAVSGTSGSETFFAGGTSGGSCTATVILYYHTVEAASTINASNITFPNDINNQRVMSDVTINNSTMNMNEIHHVITWTCGAFTGTVTTNNGATSASYNIYEACAQFPTGSSANMTITCKTYKGTRQIGSQTSRTITLTLPQINPLLTGNVAVQAASQWHGRNLAGATSVHFSGTCTPAFMSGAPSINITGGNLNLSVPSSQITARADSETWDWSADAVIPVYGSFTFNVTATCTRGLTTTITAGEEVGGEYQPTTITFVPYSPPTISASCYRCNRAGVSKRDGTFIACRIHFDYTIFDDTEPDNNSAEVRFQYAPIDGTGWINFNPPVTTVLNDSTTVLRINPADASETDDTANGGFRPDAQYKILATVTDLLNNSASAANSIGTAEVFMRWDHGHNAFGFGAYPSADQSVYLHPNWTFYTHGQEITDLISDNAYNVVNDVTHASTNAAFKTQLLDLIYPVGSIYMSMVNVNIASTLGGTWEPLGDTFLLGVGTTYGANQVGGKSTYQLRANAGAVNNDIASFSYWADLATTYQTHHAPTYNSESFGNISNPNPINHSIVVTDKNTNNATTTIMPPYRTVYMWKRTA